MKHDESTLPCPRCGYDQRGTAASWADTWPLTGTCTECGLEFDWGPVIAPQFFEPRWCVEYAATRRQFIVNSWKTFWRTLWPWKFWSRLKMSHAIRWKRLTAFIILLFCPFVLLYIAEQATVAVLVRFNVENVATQQQQAATAQIPQMQAFLQRQQSNAIPAEQRQFLQTRILQLQQSQAMGVTINQPYLAAIAEAVFLPTSRSSGGTITDAFATYPYVAPINIHSWLIDFYWPQAPMAMPRNSYQIEYIGFAISGLLVNLLIAVFIPLGFVFLPISRKKAKVRWRHVIRVLLYGVVLHVVIIMISAAVLAGAAAPIWGSLPGLPFGVAVFASSIGLMVLLNIWWAVAIKRYLKMPHGWAIAPLLTLVAVLLPATVMFNIGTMSAGSAIALMLIAVFVGGGIALIVVADQRRARRILNKPRL